MYINNEDFEIWMQKLSKKLSEIGQDLKSLINTKEVFDPEKVLLRSDGISINAPLFNADNLSLACS